MWAFHILKVIYNKKFKLIHINPGAIGKYGIHKVRTLITLEVHKNNLLNMNIIEFKKIITYHPIPLTSFSSFFIV